MKIAFTAISATLVTASLAVAAPIVRPEFQDALARVQAKTDVPMLLPTDVPVNQEFRVYASKIQHDRYEASLSMTTGCIGGSYCHFGSLKGKSMQNGFYHPEGFREAAQLYNDHGHTPPNWSPEPPARVSLENGIEGYFIPYWCGTVCNDARVVWDDGDYRFEVGLKEGQRQAVVALANSAIRNMQ